MTRRKIICLLALSMLFSINVLGQTFYKVHKDYIAKFHEPAMQAMQKYGVPASILLSQGLLESAGGTSVLATQANNHFNIKCQDWEGETFEWKADELVAETDCYRKYASAAEVFDDQANILKFTPRYKNLSQYASDDYKSWAMGLQRTGYAMSDKYAERLIKLIHHYKLYKYDKEALKNKGKGNVSAPVIKTDQSIVEQPATAVETPTKLSRSERIELARAKQKSEAEDRAAARAAKKKSAETAYATAATQTATIETQTTTAATAPAIAAPATIPATAPAAAVTPTTPAIENNKQPIIVNSNFSVGETRLIRQHDVDRINGIRYIVAQQGDTYLNIARLFRLDPRKLLGFNDIPVNSNAELKKGDLVFLQAKRMIAARGYEFHQVQAGESMYSIAQMYAIRLSNLYKLNKMRSDEQLTVGRILRLR